MLIALWVSFEERRGDFISSNLSLTSVVATWHSGLFPVGVEIALCAFSMMDVYLFLSPLN